MTRIYSLLLAIALSTGCGSESSPNPAAKAGATADQSATETSDPEGEAASHVIQGYNIIIAEVGRSIIDAYTRSFKEAAPSMDSLPGVRLTNLAVPFDRAIGDASKHFAAAKTAAPSMALVADAEAMATTASALGEAYRESLRYYVAETYKDDKGAGIAPLHEAFIKKLEAYYAARAAVARALEERERAELAADMARFEQTTVSYWLRRALVDAKSLVSTTRDLGDGSAFIAANEQLQKTAAELSAFIKTAPNAPQSFTAMTRMFVDSVATRAAKVSRDLRDPEAKEYQRESDLQTLVQYYNNLVQMANSLLEMEARGELQN